MRRVTALMLMTMAAVTALGFFMGSAGGNSSGATGQATPKPNNGGSLSGIYDALVSPHDLSGSEDGAGADSCSDTFDNGGDTLADVADPDRAYNYFVLAWMGRNGMAGTARSNHHLCARYTSNGGDPAKRWRSASYAIASIGKRLRNVTILRRDAFELLPRIEDKAGTVIYVDPPYINKGAEYIHDLASGDHKRLADILGRFQQTRVVVSYYDHPELDRLYPDFTQVKIEVTKALANQGQREAKKTKATEVLLINGPSYTESKALF